MKLIFRTLIVLTAALLLSGCAAAEDASTTLPSAPPTTAETLPPETTAPAVTEPLFPGSGNHPLRYDSETTGDYLEYYLHIPEGVEAGMPLVIFLHGDGQVDKIDELANYGMIAKSREAYGEEFPFIGLTPCTRRISWVHDTIPDTLMELIEHVVSEYQINREKVIITGHSRGAIGTWNLISLYGGYFSAAVPMSCDCGDRIIDYDKAAEVPVRAFVGYQGDLDKKYCPAMNYMCYEINQHGGDAELTVFWEYYHDATCNLAFTPDLFEWMLAQ